MVKEIHSLAEFEHETKGPGLVVVDFFTTWCGPCKAIAPFIEQLATKYPEVKFIKVDIEKNEDIAAPRRISSIPTFHFIVKGALVDEMKGANPQSLEQKVNQHKVNTNPFGGSGNKLSAGASSAAPLDPREARLRQFAAMEASKKAADSVPAPPAASVEPSEEDLALQQALALSMADTQPAQQPAATSTGKMSAQDAADYAEALAHVDAAQNETSAPEIMKKTATEEWEEEMVPVPVNEELLKELEWEEEMVPVPVNEELLKELVDMGFPDVRARKGLVHGGNLEGAIGWLEQHENDEDIDQPYMVRLKDTLPKPLLTPEEKAQKVREMQEKIKKRRDERERQEKADAIRREKERRERGQAMDSAVEERERLQRKREAEKLKREKEEAAKERQRLRDEIARDKEIRKLNKGVLPSVLGVGGYNPSAPKPVAKPASAPGIAASGDLTPPSVEKIDQAIGTISRYRTGGDGGAALKLLVTFLRNITTNPTDPKFRSINMDSTAFKSKLGSLVGPLVVLKGVGFVKDEAENKLKYEGDPSAPILVETLQKLVRAEETYRQMNPV
eukprot:gene33337-40327_t